MEIAKRMKSGFFDILRDKAQHYYLRLFWKLRSKNSVSGGLINRSYPRRGWLANHVLEVKPNKVIEFGSGYGPNLQEIAQRSPQAQCLGIDINPNSVEIGNSQARAIGLKNIEILCGGLNLFCKICPDSDVVITDTTLMYLNDRELDEFILAMKKSRPKISLHVEFHDDTLAGSCMNRDGWLRNYREAFLRNEIPIEKIEITKLEPQYCAAKNWLNHAHLIAVQYS